VSLAGILRERIEATPVTEIEMGYRGRSSRLLLKLEFCNVTGSVKDRTAVGLLSSLDRARPLTPGTVVVESTSGNLGLGLGRLLHKLDCQLIAVIDPKTPTATTKAMQSMGAEVCLVDEPDDCGGYLLSRLNKVRQLCRENPGYRWTDQYNNPANPAIHRQTTGPEIVAQMWPELDAVYIAISTGGTLAGVSAFIRNIHEHIRIVAVDVKGSRATCQSSGTERIIPGIGSSRHSSFLQPNSYDYVAFVDSPTIVAMCRLFQQSTGIALGGSGGAVVSAVVADHVAGNPPKAPLALCADGGDRYTATIYNDEWLENVGIAQQVVDCMDKFNAEDIRFRLTDGCYHQPIHQRRHPACSTL
jgi:N-(2-amino-2-carboxyethyl)-L-glutamate synthase